MGAFGTRVALLLATAVAAIQLVPVRRANPPVTGDLDAPPEVVRILRAACYDCHSNETDWPPYSLVAPVSWLIARDVEAGRRRLNFSEWADYASDPGTHVTKLEKIADAVTGGDMAPWYYRVLHPAARLTADQRQSLVQWTHSQVAASAAAASD